MARDCWSTCVREYQMHGAYRRMVLRPRSIEGSLEDDSVKVAFSLGRSEGAM